MPVSFGQLWARMQEDAGPSGSYGQVGATSADVGPNEPAPPPLTHQPDTDTSEDEPAMEAIRTGNNIRDDFWDDFIQLTNNADAVAQLLGVRTDQVTGWGARVKNMIDKVQEADKQSGGNPDDDKKKGNSKVMPTGPANLDTADTAGFDAHGDTAQSQLDALR